MHDIRSGPHGDIMFELDKPSIRLVAGIRNRNGLEDFLQEYQANILVPHELPAIMRAFRHTCRNETRDLIKLDKEIETVQILKPFLPASRRVGNAQLKRLRPLRDHRVTQRYLRAVESGLANGWHTTVYGLTLSVYSLPILEGLISYERQTLLNFVHSVARSLRMREVESGGIINDLTPFLPTKREDVLGEDEPTRAPPNVT